MIAGAVLISLAVAPASEQASWKRATERECARYGMDPKSVAAVVQGEEAFADVKLKRHWWEALIVCGALGLFAWLALGATHQAVAINVPWMVVLVAASVIFLVVSGVVLWRRTRFS